MQQTRDVAIASRRRRSLLRSCSARPVSEVGSTRRSTMSSDKRRATVLEDLPEEILVDQILILLSSKDVGRCRAVSTSWRSATSTPAFMLEHHRRQPLLPILNGRGRPASYVVFRDAGAGASSQELWPFLPVSKNRSGNCIFASYDASVRCGGCRKPGVPIFENQLLASCDGFLIIHHGPLLYICNPVIRTHALLPLPYCCGPGFTNTVIGFYRHHPTEDYRVLLVSNSRNHPKYSLHNLTVGSDELRHITVTMPAVSSPSVEQKLLMGLTSLYQCPPPFQHCASLHWCPYGANDITEGGGDIIVFDTEAESFHWMRSPTQLFYSGKLFNMKGTLAFGAISTDNTAINVWVMQDYEAETWAFRCRIDMSTVEASRELYITSLKKRRKKRTPLDSQVKSFEVMALLNERELLILFNNKHVLRCDIDGKFLGIVNIGKSQYCMSLTKHYFQESTIPIPFHEMQKEDEETPFSTGHV